MSGSALVGPLPELSTKAVAVKVYPFDGTPQTGGVDGVSHAPYDGSAKGRHRSFRRTSGARQDGLQQADRRPRPCRVFLPAPRLGLRRCRGRVIGTLDVCFQCNYATDAPGYRELAKPVRDRYDQMTDEYDEKLWRAQVAEIDGIRAKFDMPASDAPIDWVGLAALVTELGLPTEPEPSDYARLR
jgi:hypothetical protein